MIGLLALHGLCGSIGLACGDRLGRRCLLLGGIAPAATFVWLTLVLGGVLDGDPVTQSVEWVPALGMNLDLRLDGFAALMIALVAGIGVLVYGTIKTVISFLGAEQAWMQIIVGGLLLLFILIQRFIVSRSERRE